MNNPTILSIMCHEMIDSLNECLQVLDNPVENERDQLKETWKLKICTAYKILIED